MLYIRIHDDLELFNKSDKDWQRKYDLVPNDAIEKHHKGT